MNILVGGKWQVATLLPPPPVRSPSVHTVRTSTGSVYCVKSLKDTASYIHNKIYPASAIIIFFTQKDMSDALPQKRPLTTASTNHSRPRVECVESTSHGHMTTTTTTKPLITSSGKFRPSVMAPPPKTATIKRLERLLDAPPPHKKTKKTKTPPSREAPLGVGPGGVRSEPLPVWVVPPPPSRPVARPSGNALAFRGGLSSAPTFKKAVAPVSLSRIPSSQLPKRKHRHAGPTTTTPPSAGARFVGETGTMTRNNDDDSGGGPVIARPPLSTAMMDLTGASSRRGIATGSIPMTATTMTRARSTTSRDSLETAMDETGCTEWRREETRMRELSLQMSPVLEPYSSSASMANRRECTSEVSLDTTTTTRNESTNASTVPASSLKIGLQLGTTKNAAPYKRTSIMFRSGSGPPQPVTTEVSNSSSPPTRTAPVHEGATNEPTILQVIHVPELPLPKSGAADDEDRTTHDHDDNFQPCEKSVSKPLQQTSLSLSSKSTVIRSNHATTTSTTNALQGNKRARSSGVHDNFVRLNLRNSAGACRGARSKKLRRKSRYDDFNNNKKQPYGTANDSDSDAGGATIFQGNSHGQAYVSRMSGLDPMDDYLDGVYTDHKKTDHKKTDHKKRKEPKGTSNKQQTSGTDIELDAVPICARHNRPCKLVVVKKNTKGNKGRKFYACSMPRGEQCDHFEWAEDTFEAARKVVQGNSSHSSFVARQVVAHVDRFRVLTLPELREEAAQRRLNKNGKKSQLLLRLALWARDEITKAVPYPDDEKDEGITADDRMGEDRTKSTSDSVLENLLGDNESSAGSESSDDELEFYDDDSAHEEMGMECDDNSARRPGLLHQAGDSKSKLVATLKSIFGYSEFRDGQEWAIQRCLAGKRSLLVAPTGSGKSLCYSLPAALMDGVCVVVSPLISLIQDQLRSLPPRVPAATLSGSISVSATAAIIDDVVRKRIKILFVSPERLTSPSFRRLFNTTWNPDTQEHERRFPEISLLCVDEAHCVSQWAHNFRPCFLRFKRLLQLMEPRSVLAVTATAGSRVIGDITSVLGIDTTSRLDDEASGGEEKNVLIIDKPRYNIDVSCQFVESHEERLEMVR